MMHHAYVISVSREKVVGREKKGFSLRRDSGKEGVHTDRRRKKGFTQITADKGADERRFFD
jgi:hypothetical protein